MSLSSAAFTVQYALQKLSVLPYVVDPSTQLLRKDARYVSKHYKHYQKLVRVIWHYQTLFVIFRLIWLAHHWKTFTIHHLHQGILYMASMCGHLLLESLHFMLTKHQQALIYMINQTVKYSRKLKSENLNSSSFNPFRCLFVYSLSFSISFIAPVIFMMPFAISFDPHQLVFGTSHFVKLTAGVLYSLTYFNHILPMISVLLMLIAFLEGMYYLTATLTIVQTFQCFQSRYINFQKAVILVKLTVEVFSQFLTVLIFVGVLLASSCAVATLKLYFLLNAFMHVGMIGIVFACFAVAIGITYLSNLPRQNLIYFKYYWAAKKLTIVNRKMVRACKLTGFTVGSYGTVTSLMGLYICDDIVHNIASLLLIDIL